jgi:CubicO group peptidase (beta-lactamase class C family)
MRPEHLIAAITPFVEARVVPGAVVGVRSRGEIAVDAVGSATLSDADPLPVDAQVRISSNTKPMLAALTMLLVQDGVLSLDDLVERHLPELSGRRVLPRLDAALDDAQPATRSLTVEDLLTMRLGFGWVFESACPAVERAKELGLGFGPPDPPALPAPDEWIKRFATLPLLEEPGSAWRYELAFAVLGVLLARAAALPLDVLFAQRLFNPLEMTGTAFAADPTRLVPAFSRGENGLVPFDGVADSRWARAPRLLTAGAAWYRPPATFCGSQGCCWTEATGCSMPRRSRP